MDRFDDVSVIASVDESPSGPRVPRRARRAFKAVVVTVVVTGALAGASVGLADEKSEPSPSSGAPSDARPARSKDGHECHRGMRHQQSSDSSTLRH